MNREGLTEAGPGRFLISGDLSFATVSKIARSTNGLFRGASEVMIDLGQVKRADSAGLALLIEWMKQAESKGVHLAFRKVPRQLMAITQVSGLESVLPIVSCAIGNNR